MISIQVVELATATVSTVQAVVAGPSIPTVCSATRKAAQHAEALLLSLLPPLLLLLLR
jgi:hypothetical protein